MKERHLFLIAIGVVVLFFVHYHGIPYIPQDNEIRSPGEIMRMVSSAQTKDGECGYVIAFNKTIFGNSKQDFIQQCRNSGHAWEVHIPLVDNGQGWLVGVIPANVCKPRRYSLPLEDGYMMPTDPTPTEEARFTAWKRQIIDDLAK